VNSASLPIAVLFAQTETKLAESASELGNMPYIVLGGYLLLLLTLGIFGWMKSKAGEDDYYLAGRDQGWVVTSLTIMATFFSSFALLGAPGMVYRDGVVFALFSLNVPVGGLTVYLIGGRIWKLGRKFGYVTPGDLVADYYDSKYGLRILVAIAGFLYAIPYIVMQIQAGGIVSQKLFGEDTFETGAIVLATITTLYIMIGGMRSVAWTDVIQGGMLIVGMLVGGFAMLLVFDGPQDFTHRVATELPASSLTAPGNSGIWVWTKTMTLVVLASSGSMIQPAQWMRYYAARSLSALKRSAVIFAVVLTSCFLLGVMLIGLAGQVLYPLQFEISVKLAETELVVADDAPIHSAFNVASDRISINWEGKHRPELGGQDFEQLKSLNLSAGWAQSVSELQESFSDPTKRPTVKTHKKVDQDGKSFDAIILVVLNEKLPKALGSFGAIFASLMIVAIMAAAMSTADSNLHSLSAILTRDVYDQYVRPQASDRERVWVGRLIIVGASALAVALVIFGRQEKGAAESVVSHYDLLHMIAQLGFVAIAFTAQLLPMAIDVLYLRRGTRAGATAGLFCGLLGAFLFGPLFGMLADGSGIGLLGVLKTAIEVISASLPIDGSAWGLFLNIPVFILVSCLTQSVDPKKQLEFEKILQS
jgi:Na+/proline symporter